MPDIQTPAPVQALQAQFKVRSPFGLFLREDIQPVVILADLTVGSPATAGFPKLAMGFASGAAGGAGNESEVVATGVGGQGIVQVVNKIRAFKATAGVITLRVASGIGTITNSTTKQYNDLRNFSAAQIPTMLLGGKSAAAPEGSLISSEQCDGVVGIEFLVDIILGPADQIVVANNTANEALDVTMYWTEYLLEDR